MTQVQLIKSRPIPFSAPMVQALLEGRKSQTRRMVKPQPTKDANSMGWVHSSSDRTREGRFLWLQGARSEVIKCPFGKVGDVLWVRETLQLKCLVPTNLNSSSNLEVAAIYKTNPDKAFVWKGNAKREYIPSIHMPRWASRLTLEITAIKVERLQDISEENAIAEGVIFESNVPATLEGIPLHRHYVPIGKGEVISGWDAQDCYGNLWESLNGKDSWDANPWVWVIEFKTHKCNVDEFIKKEQQQAEEIAGGE